MDEARPKIIALTMSQFHDRTTADIVFQETWIVVWRRWETVAGHPNPLGFVVTTAKHICRRLQELEHRRRDVEQRLESLPPAPPADPDLGERDRVERAVAALAPRQREAIVYHYYLSFSDSEIADAMGVRPGTVKALLNQARQRLRSLLEERPEQAPTAEAAHDELQQLALEARDPLGQAPESEDDSVPSREEIRVEIQSAARRALALRATALA
jgi:RNA polymerase sigma factor (sigma-70 family)